MAKGLFTQEAMAHAVKRACEHSPDTSESLEWLKDYLGAHERIREEYVEPLIDAGLRQLLNAERYRVRAGFKREPNRCPRGLEAIKAVGQTVMASMLDGFVIGGKKLGDLTGGELLELGEGLRLQGDGLLRSAAFCEAIGQQIPEDAYARDAISAEDVAGLAVECFGPAGAPVSELAMAAGGAG